MPRTSALNALKFTMQSGYAYEFEGSRRWLASSSECWEIVVYTPTGDEKEVGSRNIDDAQCVVFKCSDGKYRAQTRVSCTTVLTSQ
jgi:hypothetical protein